MTHVDQAIYKTFDLQAVMAFHVRLPVYITHRIRNPLYGKEKKNHTNGIKFSKVNNLRLNRVIKCQNKISRNIEELAYLEIQIGPLTRAL